MWYQLAYANLWLLGNLGRNIGKHSITYCTTAGWERIYTRQERPEVLKFEKIEAEGLYAESLYTNVPVDKVFEITKKKPTQHFCIGEDF